jgi:type II secretory pathway pseudopilin PulG
MATVGKDPAGATALFIMGLIALGIFFVARAMNARARRRLEAQYEAQAQQEAAAQWHRQQQLAYEAQARELARWNDLCQRFGEANARKVLLGVPWMGATFDMIIAACGHPSDIEEQVMKTKTKYVLKYEDPLHAGRFRMKITIDDEEGVVSWKR